MPGIIFVKFQSDYSKEVKTAFENLKNPCDSFNWFWVIRSEAITIFFEIILFFYKYYTYGPNLRKKKILVFLYTHGRK